MHSKSQDNTPNRQIPDQEDEVYKYSRSMFKTFVANTLKTE